MKVLLKCKQQEAGEQNSEESCRGTDSRRSERNPQKRFLGTQQSFKKTECANNKHCTLGMS